jgi:acetylornithine deacetylase/succinyl-diaminopimelate desuccinylase-like protein
VALQDIVSRSADPVAAAVLSITSIRSNSDAFNVIPQRAVLRGTVRTPEAEVQRVVETRLAEIVATLPRALRRRSVPPRHRRNPPPPREALLHDPQLLRIAPATPPPHLDELEPRGTTASRGTRGGGAPGLTDRDRHGIGRSVDGSVLVSVTDPDWRRS